MLNNDIVPGFDDEKDENLKIKLQLISAVENCLAMTLNGYIDTYNSNFFLKRAQLTIEAGFDRLILNCSGLNYISSTGIGAFTAVLKAAKAKGGDLVLLDVQSKVYEVFQLLGFSQFFNIKEKHDEAVGFFKGNDNANTIPVFPVVISCPICSRKLNAVKPGRFRCSECKNVLEINEHGKVLVG